MENNIVVPELGGATSKAKVTNWYKKVGDQINTGDVLLTLEAQKVVFEVSAEAAGILTQVHFQTGTEVKIGDVLGAIDEQA